MKISQTFLSYRADTILWQTDGRTDGQIGGQTDRRAGSKQYVSQPYGGRHNYWTANQVLLLKNVTIIIITVVFFIRTNTWNMQIDSKYSILLNPQNNFIFISFFIFLFMFFVCVLYSPPYAGMQSRDRCVQREQAPALRYCLQEP